MKTFEITGTRTLNRGADLMTYAICDHLGEEFDNCRISVPNYFGNFKERGSRGLFCTLDHPGKKAFLSTCTMRIAPAWIKQSIGICAPGEIDVVLDANGFAFSDQWGPGAAVELHATMSSRARKNQTLILMPQAMGPFTNRKVKCSTQRLFERASLICARDETSLNHCKQLGNYPHLLKFPDFSIYAKPVDAPSHFLENQYSFIIPNARMLDKAAESNLYLKFLQSAAFMLSELQMRPAFLIHGGEEDRKLLSFLNLPKDVQIVESSDSRTLKAIIGTAKLVVGSRFHALVSAFSQGVPCIGAGWSHKYAELFSEYSSSSFLLQSLGDMEALRVAVEAMSSDVKYKNLVAGIKLCSSTHLNSVKEMWKIVDSVIAKGHLVAA